MPLPLPSAHNLTQREILALQAKAYDKSQLEIADVLGIKTERGVRAILTRAAGKLGAAGHVGAVLMAYEYGYIELPRQKIQQLQSFPQPPTKNKSGEPMSENLDFLETPEYLKWLLPNFSDSQCKVLVCLATAEVGSEPTIADLAESCDISETAVSKRLRKIYPKFGLFGDRQGKKHELCCLLQQHYFPPHLFD